MLDSSVIMPSSEMKPKEFANSHTKNSVLSPLSKDSFTEWCNKDL